MKTSPKSQEDFTELLQHTFSEISNEINWCLKYNQGFTFDTGKFGERVLFIVENTKGVPSNGGCAFDSEKGSEGKSCFLAQTYTCPDCKSKNNYYAKECHKCGSTNREDPKDSRWGIDVKAHFKYLNQIPCYIFTHVEPLNQDSNNPKYRIKVFKIDSKNPMFNDILQHQMNYGKKAHKNFMPFGRDFYMSSPIPLVDCVVNVKGKDINISYNFYCPDNQDTLTKMPISVFTKKERTLISQISNNMVLIEEAINIIGVKKSTHGKERGTLDRNKNL
jgi:ribosomal protein L40E